MTPSPGSKRDTIQQPDCLASSLGLNLGIMNVYIVALLICSLSSVSPQNWLFSPDFFHQPGTMKAFFNSGYEGARKMKESVNSYVEEQQRKFSNDFNSYVESARKNSKRVVDSWSYLPSDDAESKLENPDMVLSVPAIISRHGYPCEIHTVVSQGYILNIHRIPRSKSGGDVPTKTVLLQHGIFASSADWIINGPEKGLGYVLADAGYDVWMTNIRGNRYSREHAWLKADSKSYWNFSWHDVALHDVPTVIDYITKLKGTGTKLTYIGHSMGTTILFAMLCLRPEYNDILSAAFALAPTVFMSDLKSPLKSFAPLLSYVAYMEMLYGSYEFIPKKSSLGRYSSSCEVDKMDFMVCKSGIFYICGYDDKQLNKTLLPMFLAHLWTGTSWKTALHFTQEIVSGGKFQQFDYGSSHNLKIYGTETVPEYDLSKVTLPVTLFWAQNDLLSSEKDVKMLYERLPSTTEMYMVPFPEFNHLDYLWAVDAPSLVNEKLLSSLRKVYEKEDEFFFDFRFRK